MIPQRKMVLLGVVRLRRQRQPRELLPVPRQRARRHRELLQIHRINSKIPAPANKLDLAPHTIIHKRPTKVLSNYFDEPTVSGLDAADCPLPGPCGRGFGEEA